MLALSVVHLWAMGSLGGGQVCLECKGGWREVGCQMKQIARERETDREERERGERERGK